MSDAVAWNRYQSVSRFVVMPRTVPRRTVGVAVGAATVVKRFGVESQPWFVAGPKLGSTSGIEPGGIEAAQVVHTVPPVQAEPLSLIVSVKAFVCGPLLKCETQTQYVFPKVEHQLTCDAFRLPQKSSSTPQIDRPSQRPHMTIMTESNTGDVPHMDAVIVLPVPVTLYQTPRRFDMPVVNAPTLLTKAFDSTVAPETVPATATEGEEGPGIACALAQLSLFGVGAARLRTTGGYALPGFGP